VQVIVVQVLVLVFSVVFHEYAHGMAAYRLGDDTARLHGRLTLNPLNHIDPVGSIIVPLVLAFTGGMMFGWAKPVPVRVGKLNDPRNDHPKVAFAGPLANLLLALISAIGLGVVVGLGSHHEATAVAMMTRPQSVPAFLILLFQTGIMLNLLLALFNLMPVPPLDGSWILSRFLPVGARIHYENLRRFGFLPVIAFIVLLQVSPLGNWFHSLIFGAFQAFVGITDSVIALLT
jgi:Zn-dependent protease